MLFTTETISNEEIKSINNFFNEFEAVETVAPEKAEEETTVVKYQLKILQIQKLVTES